jgi:hypothetical protein
MRAISAPHVSVQQSVADRIRTAFVGEFIAEIFGTILPEEMPSVAEHIGDWRPRTILHVGAAAMNPQLRCGSHVCSGG